MTSVMTTEKNWLGILHTGTPPPLPYPPPPTQPSLWSLVLRYMTFPVFVIILSCLLRAKAVSFVCVWPFWKRATCYWQSRVLCDSFCEFSTSCQPVTLGSIC